jgi:radical SAM superfamily enzyme YgiQ (UPF0313 family)
MVTHTILIFKIDGIVIFIREILFMKISFIVPAPDVRRSFIYRLGSVFYGPNNSITGPLILGALLKKAGHDVSVYEELEKNVNFEKLLDSDVICIYTMTSNSRRAYYLADYFREKYQIRVVLGGIHATYLPHECLEHADQVVIGEAEKVIVDVIEGRIKDKIVKSEPVRDLDEIPFSDYSLLKTGCKAVNVLTSRGCPHSCTFCSSSRMFYPYRKRSVENIIEELRVHKKAGVKYLNFQDDNLIADKKRVKILLRRMIAEDLVFRETFFFGRIEIIEDDELLELLQKANLKRVLIGIETINQKSLNNINKRLFVSDLLKLKNKLKKYEIKLVASIVLGFDSDDINDIRKTVDFCLSINPFQLQPSILTPFPGTPIFKEMDKAGRIVDYNWEKYDMTHVVFKPKQISNYDLSHEYFSTVKKFYSFKSLPDFYKTYGFKEAVIRTVLSALIQLLCRFFIMKIKTDDKQAGIREKPQNLKIYSNIKPEFEKEPAVIYDNMK